MDLITGNNYNKVDECLDKIIEIIKPKKKYVFDCKWTW